MSFPRYEHYKDSGVEWLGEVPAHWDLKSVRRVAELNPSKSEAAHLDRETEVSFLPMEAVGDDGKLNLDRTRPIKEVETGYTFFKDGDVAIAKITPCFENGKGAVMTGLQNGFGFGTTELIVTRPKLGHVTSYFLHWLYLSTMFRKTAEAAMYGAGGQKRVPDDFVRDFVTAFPPISEQGTISAFLARETAKLDALITEQRTLIDLLKEKRQAVISHAVTKGLDPDVAMKDSGVEWLGEVPAHWEIVRLKRAVVLQRGHDLPSEERQEGEIPIVSSGGITGWHHQAQAKGPGIVTGRYGTIGQFTFVEDDYWPLNTTLYSVDLFDNVPRFIWYMLQNISVLFLMNSGKSAVPGVDRNDLHPVPVVVPPVIEQNGIVDFLAIEIARLDALTAEAETTIALLQERRSALISAAVTGKIDVRQAA